MPLICLFGPDGSGKTTIASILAILLSRYGFNVRVSWMRGTHLFASILARFLSNFQLFRGYDNPYYGLTIPKRFRVFWQLVESISVIPILLVKFIIPQLLGYIIICDRFIPDFLVWVALTTRDLKFLNSFTAKFMFKLLFKVEVKIYITASLSTLVRRSGEKYSYLSRQLKLYDRIVKAIRAYKVDTTNRSIRDTINYITGILKPVIYKSISHTQM